MARHRSPHEDDMQSVTGRVSQAELDALDAVARQQERSRAWAIRDAIRKYVGERAGAESEGVAHG